MFLHLDRVTFDDRAGPANTSVNIAETVVPDTVTVNGSLDYVFTGTGKISRRPDREKRRRQAGHCDR